MFKSFGRWVAAGVVCSLLGAGGLASVSDAALAQAQLQEMKITAPAAAGGGWDSTARALQQAMTEAGVVTSVQVVNVPGAAGTVGLAQFVNEARGRGDQLLVSGFVMVGGILTNGSPVTLDQVTPIARLTGEPLVIVVPKDSPIQSVQDLSAAIKQDVASATWAGGSAGGADHILAGLFTQAAGGDASKVNYVAFSGGGEALAAMLGGRVTAGVSGYSEFEGQIQSGELRALAISTAERLPNVDVPTLKEQGVDIDMVNWRGVMAGPDLSDEDKQKLSAVVDATVKSPQWQELLKARGWTDFYQPADEFAGFLKEENTRIEGILKTIGLVQ